MFDTALKSSYPLAQWITPLAPYFICNHFLSTEVYPSSPKYIGMSLPLRANDLLLHKNYTAIQSFHMVQVQVDLFDFFCDTVLPILAKRKVKIILITSQWHLPQLQPTAKTYALLHHPSIFLWISQNPIYTHPKYMGFPYGLLHRTLTYYLHFIRTTSILKTTTLVNQHASVHAHFPDDHIRKKYDLFGKNSGAPLKYKDYLQAISKSHFVISTTGDRDDCYRHYECIGLHAIPISNIDLKYKCIFGETMVYSNAEDMKHMVLTQQVPYKSSLNKDVLTLAYWKREIHNKIELLQQRDTLKKNVAPYRPSCASEDYLRGETKVHSASQPRVCS
jgi:hypothetical protein